MAVTGIGGFFFRARDPKALAAWYLEYLGVGAPKGKYVIRVCDGTACHVKGSQDLVDVLQENLKLTPSRRTTLDMMFTLETVSCLGACGLAPAMVVNDEVHGQVKPEAAQAILAGIQQQEGM